MANIRDYDIRNTLANKITTSLATFYTGTNRIVRVHDHWIIDIEVGESANILKAVEGITKGKVDSWVIGVDSIGVIRPDEKDGYMSGVLKTRGPARRDQTRRYKLWRGIQLNNGTSASNSENELTDELDFMGDAIANDPTLGLSQIQCCSEFQWDPIDTFQFGKDSVLLAVGFIEFKVYRQLV